MNVDQAVNIVAGEYVKTIETLSARIATQAVQIAQLQEDIKVATEKLAPKDTETGDEKVT